MTRSRSGLVAVALALGGAGLPAAAWVRTTSELNGVPLFWPVPVVAFDLSSVPGRLSPTCDVAGTVDPVEDVVRASFETWEQGCSALRLVYGGKIPETRAGTGGSPESVVMVRKGWCSQVVPTDPCRTDPYADCGAIYDCFDDAGAVDWGTVALTTVLYNPESGRIYEADIQLNGWDGQAGSVPDSLPAHGFYFTCDKRAGWGRCTTYGQADCFAYDLQNTVTHEAGHFIGLGHPCERYPGYGVPTCTSALPPGETVPYAQRTMYPMTAMGETSKRVLSPDDVAGVCTVYPAQGGCGCGAGGAPGAVAAALAALALRSLTRRARPRTRRPGAGRR